MVLPQRGSREGALKMIINCKIVQTEDEVLIMTKSGKAHRKQNVWITPDDPKERVPWTSIVTLWNEGIDRFITSGYKPGLTVPVSIKPSTRRKQRGGEVTEESEPYVYMDFYYGGQNNG